MARKKIIAGNWKMNMTPSEAVKLVETLKPLVYHLSGHRYPFPFIRVLFSCFSGASTTSQYYHTDDKH